MIQFRSAVTRSKLIRAIGLVAWVYLGFMAAQFSIIPVLLGLKALGVDVSSLINKPVFDTVVAASVYALAIAFVIGIPWLIRRYRTSRKDIGLTRLPTWMDILLSPAGFVVYLLVSSVIVYIAGRILPNFNPEQAQNVGFQNLANHFEYFLAFLTLVVIAPLAEEILMRGYLYGKLRKFVPVWLAMIITSALFGVLHGQWNVGVDVFALSLVLCSLREVTGSIWAGVLLHMAKNGLAFYLLFVNPALLHTIGG